MMNDQDMIGFIQRTDPKCMMPIMIHQYSGGARTFVKNGKDWTVQSAVQVFNDVTGEQVPTTLVSTKKPTYVKGTGKTGRVKGAKQVKAQELFTANPKMTGKELVALFMKELDMTKAGATTYAYNVRKAAGLVQEKGKKAAKQ